MYSIFHNLCHLGNINCEFFYSSFSNLAKLVIKLITFFLCSSDFYTVIKYFVTLVDHDHIGWKSWKLIAQTISPISPLFVAQRSSTYSQGNMEKFWGENVRSTPTSITSSWIVSTESRDLRWRCGCLFTFVGTSRGHLCDSTAFLFHICVLCYRVYLFMMLSVVDECNYATSKPPIKSCCLHAVPPPLHSLTPTFLSLPVHYFNHFPFFHSVNYFHLLSFLASRFLSIIGLSGSFCSLLLLSQPCAWKRGHHTGKQTQALTASVSEK